MLKLTRRQTLLGVVCAGLVLLPVAGWSATRPSGQASAGPGADRRSGASSAGAPFPADRVSGSAAAWLSGSAPASGGSGPAGDGSGAAGGSGSSGGSGPAGGASGSVAGGTAPGAGTTLGTSALPPPVGWRLTDVPKFAPTPPPEPIVLPRGDEAPFLSRIPVTQPVAFLTIDDGYLKPAEAEKLFAAADIPVTLFLTTDAIQDNVPFFDRLRAHGAVIEAHTISHPELRGRSRAFQQHQICDGADKLGGWYGRRPVLFRPPFGDKDRTTLSVAHGCGLKAAFMWKETVDKGIVRYQEGHTVKPGDIILMHFRPAFVKDFLAALQAIHRAGLTPALLEDYIPT